MKIKALIEGKVFKNYRDLCEQLEIPVKAGNSKKAQLRDIEKYCKLEKGIGHNIVVKEVYDFPVEHKETRGRPSIYGELMQLIISDYLVEHMSESGKNSLIITRNKLLENIDAINSNFRLASRNIGYLSSYSKIDEDIINDFYETSNGSLKSAVETALNGLRRDTSLMYNKIIMVYKNGRHVRVSEEDANMILAAETRALIELGLRDISDVITKKKWSVFMRTVLNGIDPESKIKFYYTAYEIFTNEEFIEKIHLDKLKRISDKIERKEKRDELNTTIASRLIENAIRRREKSHHGAYKYETRLKPSYEKDNAMLVEMLIDSQDKNVVDFHRRGIQDERDKI